MTALNAVPVTSAAVMLGMAQGSDASMSILIVICVPLSPRDMSLQRGGHVVLTSITSTVSDLTHLLSGPMFIRCLYVLGTI